MLNTRDFQRRLLRLILLTWMLPPLVGLSFILYIRILSPGQMRDILLTPLEPVYIIGWLGFALWYFPRYLRPVTVWLSERSTESARGALLRMRGFPLQFWSIFLFYLLLAPSSVIVSAELYTDFTARPVDWFRIHLVALIVSILVGLPIFFKILDLFGQTLGDIPLTRPHVTLKTKVFLIGALVPLLIDTMLVQYYWTRTGFFTFETFGVWLALELLAIAGSVIFVRSIGQSMLPLQGIIAECARTTDTERSVQLPMSTDELGVLATGYRSLLHELHIHNRILALNNQLLRVTGETSSLPALLDAIVSLCHEAIGDDMTFLILKDENRDELVGVTQTGAAYNPAGHFRLTLDETALPVWVYQQGVTLAIDDVASDPRVNPRMCEQFSVKSALATPLKSDAESIGVLMSISHKQLHYYSNNEVKLIEGLGHEATLAIMAARLGARRRAAEQATAEREEHFRRLVESTTAIPWELDVNTWRFTYIGPQAEKVLGYPAAAWYEENFWPEHIHPDDAHRAVAFCQSAAARHEDHNFEYRMLAADGRIVWIRDDVQVVVNNGQATHLHGFMFDISERKQDEIALRKSKTLLAEAQRIAHLGSWELDLVNNILYWSDEIYRMFEVDSSRFEASYEAFLAAIHPDDRERVNTAYTDSVKNRTPYDLEHRLLMNDGSVKFVHESCETHYDKSGNPLRSIGTVQDVTERVIADQKLRRHREELEQRVAARTTELTAANQELESFSYSVSHDLRAPLRAIDGYSRTLLEDYRGRLDEQGVSYLERVCSNTVRMSELIDDLLNLSRIGRVEIKTAPVDLARLARQVMDKLQEHQPERQVDFRIQQLDAPVQGDKRLLHVALENLLNNAWKYSSDKALSEITFGTLTRGGETVYFVKDNGAGFDMAYADRLFGAFQRLHQRGEFEGTGIGLATVARIIRRHGGRIWADAEVGKGATFYFTLAQPHSRPVTESRGSQAGPAD